MKNLAHAADCDRQIREELGRAGIPIIATDRSGREVPYTLTGKLGPFTFTRAWCYWIVDGAVPMRAAQEMYEHPEGRRAVRVGGMAGNDAPERWIVGRQHDTPVVMKYHIDTQAGLLLFVETVRRHGLVEAKAHG